MVFEDYYAKLFKSELTDEEEKELLNKKRKERKENMKPVDKSDTIGPGRPKSDSIGSGRPKGDTWILTPRMMSDKIVKRRIIKHYNANFYMYEDGRYKNRYMGEPVEVLLGIDTEKIFYDIKKDDKTLKNEVTNNYTKEVIGHFSRDRHIFEEDIDKNLIGVKNGILNIKKYPYELLKPDSSLFTAINIPVIYDPGAIAINFKAFERSLLIKKYADEFGNIYDDDFVNLLDNEIKTFEEMFGYPFEYGYPIKKAILLLGPSNCGKTTFYKVVNIFFGKDNIAAVSLYDLGDKNRPEIMIGKLINNVADIGYNNLERRTIENFMIYTGGEEHIMVEKKYCNPTQYKPTIKMYYGSNFTPYVNLNNRPFLGRWIVIKFPDNNFPFDGHFTDRLTTEKEKSGILNLALEGLNRTRKNKGFSLRQSEKFIKKIFEENRLKDESGKVDTLRSERSDKGTKRDSDSRRFGDESVSNIRKK